MYWNQTWDYRLVMMVSDEPPTAHHSCQYYWIIIFTPKSSLKVAKYDKICRITRNKVAKKINVRFIVAYRQYVAILIVWTVSRSSCTITELATLSLMLDRLATPTAFRSLLISMSWGSCVLSRILRCSALLQAGGCFWEVPTHARTHNNGCA